MENFPLSCYENLKRYWRRRKYQKLYGSNDYNNNNNKRKLKITRLGDGSSRRSRQWKISDNNKPKLMCLKRIFSPVNLMRKFHEAYVDVMSRLAGSVAHKSSGAGAFSGKKVAKTEQISMVCEELVDTKLVLEIYKRLAASRQLDIIVN